MRERHRSMLRPSVLLALAAFTAACGSNVETTSTDDLKEPQTLSTCTADIQQTNGKSCGKEGLSCNFVIACGSFTQLARCTCADGRFACTDSTGEVSPGASPQCVKNALPSEEMCPATMFDATGASCDTLGRSCFYQGDFCPERPLPVRHLDFCQCERAQSGDMFFVCRKALCNPLLED
ncbi:MAG: hypothetical protein ABIP39_04195 [Polyangiaceae bacterium]